MMNKIQFGVGALALLVAAISFSQQQPAQRPVPAPASGPNSPPPMTFFVTSKTPTGTGNLGGLAGADKICQDLAASVGAGNRTWHAYLSTQANPQGRVLSENVVNARDRIGKGPWNNAKGVLIASSVEDLHGDIQRDSNNIQPHTALTEKGEVKGANDTPKAHDVLTGSDSHGRAFPFPVGRGGTDMTCNNWTSDSPDNKAMVGHTDRAGNTNTSWNAAHMSKDCTKAGLVEYQGAGDLYCFAIN